jgi:LysM repeat protein
LLRQNPRIPSSCPEGFKGRYVVSPGDSLYILSQIFRVRLEALYSANSHIPNPNLLMPGDVLCVPSLIPIPCCIQLQKRGRLPFGTGATAFTNFGPRGGQSISVLATLPAPSYFGNYDIYIATAYFRGIGGFGNQLFPTSEDPPTWSSRIELPTAISLTYDVRITIQPSNSRTGFSGSVIYENTLQECSGCEKGNLS